MDTLNALKVPLERAVLAGGNAWRKKAASKALEIRSCWGSTQTVYLGWDEKAVRSAAKRHAEREAKEEQADADEREAEKASRHEKYLAGAKKLRGSNLATPVGRYLVDCETIENGWPDQIEGGIAIDISETSTPGIYQGSFNFGVITGMMILSIDKGLLKPFCADGLGEVENDDDDDDDDDDEDGHEEDDEEEDEDEEDEDEEDDSEVDSENEFCAPTASNLKRKAAPSRERPPKKAKSEDEKGTKYFLCFEGTGFSPFMGAAGMDPIRRKVPFSGRKVSETPKKSQDKWENYSWDAYEDARINRW
ncbi:hypothetical protein OQA88_5750 [Cercophora sp. LCS_1]